MISVLIDATNDPGPLARLLAALVPAAAEGLVRQVAVMGAAGPARLVADDAGAHLFAAGEVAEAVRQARSDWIARLPPAADLGPGWMERVGAHMAEQPARPARLICNDAGFLRRAPEGWLVPRPLAPSAVAVEQDLQRLARRSGVRLRVLHRR